MKKILLVILSAAAFSAIHAQNTAFGIQGGATFSSFKTEDAGESETSDMQTGFTVGVIGNVGLSENFSFRPALNFTQKGGKLKDELTDEKIKFTLNYLELPLNFTYNTTPANGQFFVGVGPSLAFGLSGKAKGGGSSSDVNFGSGDDDILKPFELGANVIAGYEFSNGIFISANFNAGLSNIANVENSDEGKWHNRYFGVRLGYLFGQRASSANTTTTP